MSDTSVIPVRRVRDPRHAAAKTKVDGKDPSPLPSVSPAGPRKLIRPTLPIGTSAGRYPARVSTISPPLTSRSNGSAALGENSHAEAFYFQKQIQSQTSMIFVLEDGAPIEGTIEWYDRNVVKVRRGTMRTLIYKASIKYLYKSSDTAVSR
jgi:sRNA-binding regulator protein Hfq